MNSREGLRAVPSNQHPSIEIQQLGVFFESRAVRFPCEARPKSPYSEAHRRIQKGWVQRFFRSSAHRLMVRVFLVTMVFMGDCQPYIDHGQKSKDEGLNYRDDGPEEIKHHRDKEKWGPMGHLSKYSDDGMVTGHISKKTKAQAERADEV